MGFRDREIEDLKKETAVLKNVILSIVENLVVYREQYMSKKDILKIMGWTDAQFRYQIPELQKYGLIKAVGFRIPYSGLINYLISRGE